MKRIELNLHTKMGNGLIEPKNVIQEMTSRGYQAIAITDDNSVQSFLEVYKSLLKYNKNQKEPFQVLYGTELNIMDTHEAFPFEKETFIVLDIKTTELGQTDEIIEIAAQKWNHKHVIETFYEKIKSNNKKVEQITNIKNEMLDKEQVKSVIQTLEIFIGTLPIVTYNASYVKLFFTRYMKQEPTNPMYDILKLAQYLYPKLKTVSISNIADHLDISYKNRGLKHNIEVFRQIIFKMWNEKKIQNKSPFKITIMARNKKGLQNLYRLITLIHTKYSVRKGIPLKEVGKLSEGLLLGATAHDGEIVRYLDIKTKEELAQMMLFYDYVEISPNLSKEQVKHILDIATQNKKRVVATSNVHYLEQKEKFSFQVLTKQKTLSMNFSLLTTEEMLEKFSFLGKKKAYEVVIQNPSIIKDLCEDISILSEDVTLPEIPNGDIKLAREVYRKAHLLYGVCLPKEVIDRIAVELYGTPILKLKHIVPAIILGRKVVLEHVLECSGKGILGAGYEAMFLIPKMLIEASLKKQYKTESRGTVGSSFVAYLLGITEVNPLPPHYRCPKCGHTIFIKNQVSSGYDLKDNHCPNCDLLMKKDGHNIPYASFLGVEASCLPNIDINFSDKIVGQIKKEAGKMFGKENVVFPGTIGVMKYNDIEVLIYRNLSQIKTNEAIHKIMENLVNVKTRMGIYPGGLLVIPKNREITEFTPIEHIGNCTITHFDYHDLKNVFPKFGLLGHTDPTMLSIIEQYSNIDIMNIPFDDKNVFELLKSTKPLQLKKKLGIEVGTIGISEFYLWRGMQELKELGQLPKDFSECVKVLGLSHGTGTWEDNGLELLKQKIPLKNLIAHREDIMNQLLDHSIPYEEAFEIMEFIGKGKCKKEVETWNKMKKRLQEVGIEDWYIASCEKIIYLFPRAHHVSYMINIYRFMYVKIYEPKVFYQAYLKANFEEIPKEWLKKGYEEMKKEIEDLKNKKWHSCQEAFFLDISDIVLEALARNIDIAS